MKKLCLLLTAALLLAAIPMTAAAEEEIPEAEPQETVEELLYEYSLDAEGHAELIDFIPIDTYEGPVVIPSEIEGHPVDYVGNACFMNAAGITEITIPAGITDMGDSVFIGCTSLQAFHVEEGNPYYSTTEDGILLADNGGLLVGYPAAKEDSTYTIPATVDEIAPSAFGFSKNLTEIDIPEGVNYIDNWAFAYSGIQKVTIPGSVIQIDNYAFAYCAELSEVILSPGIDTILHAAFYCDAALEQVTLPDTLTYIGQYAFCGTGMSCVTIPDSLEEISYCAFGYDKDMKAISGFIIYGEPFSMAETYATDYDLENDYQNNFKFIAVADASIPYELGGGTLYEDAAEDAEQVMTETDENGQVIVLQTNENGNPVDPTEELGAGLKDNRKLQMMLGIGGGVAVLLAVILIAAFAKKPKNAEETASDAPEQESPDSEQEDEEA